MDVLIGGERYIKENDPSNQSIGIGVTTHNRKQLVSRTVARLARLTPQAKIVVVDDASDEPVSIKGVEVYRFSSNVGIARAKNKCLELLAGCDHIFLFDDDTYPEDPYWYKPYVDSSEHHLMYLFETWSSGNPVGDDTTLYEDGLIVAHSHARGCMLYVDKLVLETVGGMDTRYGKAMNEHLDWSNRIHNAGLTTFRYMDVPNSYNLIHSMDEHQEVQSSIPRIERRMLAQNNAELLQESATSTRYAPYGKDLILTCYFSGVPDPQRNNERWDSDLERIWTLRHSADHYNVDFGLIHNCFELPNLTTIQGSPYFERWLKEWQYLRDHPEVEWVFVTDSTDVEMLRPPFGKLERGRLYIGDEPDQTLNNEWLLTRHLENTVNSYFRANPDKQLLNCGVVGGDRATVMAVCRDIYLYGFDHPNEKTEMGIFNYLMHTKYADCIEFGRHVTTPFKSYIRTNEAWFMHK